MPVDEVLEVFTPPQQGTPVLLKLNEWYLLQSYPIAPYRNERGDMMVPLRVVGELLGGQVYLDKVQKSGLIVSNSYDDYTNHKLEFQSGSSMVRVDEGRVEVASAPYWLEASGELIVPLEPLLETFGIYPTGASDGYILPLFSYATPGYFAILETYNRAGGWIPSGYVDTEQLVPRNVTVRRVRARGARGTPGSLHIALDLKQTSGPPIPQGQQGFFTLLFKDGGVTLGGRDTAQVLGPGNEDPCRKRKGGFRCQQAFSDSSADYIMALVRVRE